MCGLPRLVCAGLEGGSVGDGDAATAERDPAGPLQLAEGAGHDLAGRAELGGQMLLGGAHRVCATRKIDQLPGVQEVEVKVVLDPPWDPSKMSEEARLELGMM